MANFPNWTQTVTSGMQASTIMRLIITNYILLQSQVRNAMGAYSNFEGYMKAMFSSTGHLLPETLQHDIIKNITTNQHHTKFHATSHVTATNAIPIATSTKPGLISTTLYKKVYNTVSNANARPITVSSYTGNGSNLSIVLGYKPRYMKIFQTTSRGFVFDIPWASKTGIGVPRHGTKHKSLAPGSASGAHHHALNTQFVTCGTSGFTVYVSANVNLAHYNFLAIG